MISGLNSSSFATAIRAAGTARKTMDTMTRQIATGQKVASVKDDGAAWARAAELKSTRQEWEARDTLVDRAMPAIDIHLETVENTDRALFRLQELILAARASVAGSSTRAAIAAEWNEVTEWTQGHNASNTLQTFVGSGAGSGWVSGGYDIGANDTYFAGQSLNVWPHGSAFHNWIALQDASRPVALRGFDILNATSAQLSDAQTSAASLRSAAVNHMRYGATDHRSLNAVRRDIEGNLDRLDTAVGSLTDADMGKASVNLRQAETRQQLANATVR